MSVDEYGLFVAIVNLRVFSDLIAEVAARQTKPSCGFRLHSTRQVDRTRDQASFQLCERFPDIQLLRDLRHELLDVELHMRGR